VLNKLDETSANKKAVRGGEQVLRKNRVLAAARSILSLTLLSLTGCIQTTSSTPLPSSAASAANDSLANFGDILRGSPSNNDSNAAPKITGSARSANSGEPQGANTSPVIFDQNRFGDKDNLGARANTIGPQMNAETSAGFVPAAYKTADNGITPSDGDKFQVAFENAEINFVARAILSDTLKVNYVIDPRVHGTVSLSAQRPISRKQLLLLLEVALRGQGAVLANQEGIFRIIPVSEANGIGETNIGPDAGSPGFGTTALPLDRISAEALSKILDGFGAPTGSVKVDASRNLLIVRGTTSERQWVIDTALAFDVDWMRNQSVGVFPVSRSSPEVVINELNQMADSSIVKFQPITRMNAILAVSKSPDTIRQIKTWIARLDRGSDYGPRAHVFRLKSADARKIVGILRDIYGGGGSSLTGSEQVAPQGPAAIAKSPGASASAPPPDANREATLGSTKMGEPGASVGMDGTAATRIRITADVAGNAVIVFANEQDYRAIERTILDIDHPTPEVAIEAIAAEVTLNDNLTYGVQYFLQSVANGNTGSIAQLSAALPLAQAIPGFNVVLGGLTNPKVVINALRDVTEVKVLSSPSLVVADNQPAVLQVGDQVPVTTGTATSTITSQAAIVNSVSYVDTGVILRVTPHIYRTSQVKLEVEQEVSAVEQNANSQTLTPTISQQKVKSTVDVENGQTVLLAGLISQQVNKEKTGIPGMIDVPILGNILSNSTNSGVRKELIIFVKPQIVRHRVDAENIARDLRRRMPGFNDW
jgi:general secretion pathway protein D